MRYWITTVAVLAALSASLALAEDFKTINGKIYKDATISRVDSDGIVLRTKAGISKVYFVELPRELQERFYYDPAKTATTQREHKLIDLKSWARATANPTSFALLLVGGASLIAAGVFAKVQAFLRTQRRLSDDRLRSQARTRKKSLTEILKIQK